MLKNAYIYSQNKKMLFKNLFSLLIISLFLFSCKTKEKKTSDYLQNSDAVISQAIENNKKVTTIQPGDDLVIFIMAKDMDVAAPFNRNYTSSSVYQYSAPSGNSPYQSQSTQTGPSYLVDSNGNIDFPVIGPINTTEKTTEQLKEELKSILKKYIKDPIVSIKTSNFKISVLGEVTRAGYYNIPDGKITFLDALALAGDLTIYGRRDNILLIRDNGEIKQRIDITDANFFNSPYYFLKQNDIIYISPNEAKQKLGKQDPNLGAYLTGAGLLITILALIFKK